MTQRPARRAIGRGRLRDAADLADGLVSVNGIITAT